MRRAVVGLLVFAAWGCKNTDEPSSPATSPPATAPAAPATVAAAGPVPPPNKPGLVEGGTVHPHHEEAVVECPVQVPEPGESPGSAGVRGARGDEIDDDAQLSMLLDAANDQIDKANYAAAWTCADRAADLAPQSVEAHHLRGAALAALGRDDEAQLAYSLALALDPDDPETLRAVGDFYINGSGKAARGRDALRLGLELAQRGSRREVARRRRNPALAADLAVLEAQALDDLGRSDEALARCDAALRMSANRGDALHERGVALFDLSRFVEAKQAFAKALTVQPDDAYTHQMYGLVLEELGDQAGADAELARAVQLAPGELFPAVMIDKAEFQKEIDAVLATLPPDRRAHVRAIHIEVADLPAGDDLAAVSPPFPPTILGLYRGPVGSGGGPVGAAGSHGSATADDPPSIVLYRKNLARAVKTRTELTEQIRDTLLHEIGHLEGLDEDDLRRRGME